MYIVLFIVMMIDYFLTYWGLNLGFIREGNPLMQWLMDMPLYYGVFVKLAICSALVFPLFIFRNKARKVSRAGLIVAFAAYAYVFSMHGYWIYICFVKLHYVL